MQLKKISSYELDRCYAVAPLKYQGRDHILVAAEKENKCLLFDQEGNLEDTIWEEPGGTMSIVQVPGSDGWFLATHKFYSPNNSADAKIVLVRPENGKWKVQTVKELPFVHRFSIISRGNVNYLIACTLKSGHEYKDDWRFPGKIYVGELPGNLEDYNEEHQISMTVLKEGLLKNHGYCTVHDKDGDYSLVGTENGVYKAVPPEAGKGDWVCEQILPVPVSDMALADFDGDGVEEMITISPFHGDHISVYRLINGRYEKAWDCPVSMEMSHAIWVRSIYGRDAAVIGFRKGERNLVLFTYEDGEYKTQILDRDVGSANVYSYDFREKAMLVSANRETNEIAFYEFLR